jgi:hypothetical protein
MVIQTDLLQIIEDAEPFLQQIWKQRRSDSDIIVLVDVEREDTREFIHGWWSDREVTRLKQQRGVGLLFLPYLQPAKLIEVLIGHGGVEREAALELRVFITLGLVPLWVIRRGGHWATCWVPPGINAGVFRGSPGPPHGQTRCQLGRGGSGREAREVEGRVRWK